MSVIEFVDHSTVKLYKTNASDLDVARAAWVSQDGSADQREADHGRIGGLIKYLMRNRHMSPFEHGQFTFVIDAPIFVAREFMRHRTMSFNEVSGRYVELKPRFYIPGPDRPLVQEGKIGAYSFEMGSAEQRDFMTMQLKDAARTEWERYALMLQHGIAREVARDVLPFHLMSQWWATVNPRNLMAFLEVRQDKTALWEIRDVAYQMADILNCAMPLTYAAWRQCR